MDGGRFRALPESYLNSPPLANTTEEERRFTLSGPTLRSPSQRATSCQRGASALRKCATCRRRRIQDRRRRQAPSVSQNGEAWRHRARLQVQPRVEAVV